MTAVNDSRARSSSSSASRSRDSSSGESRCHWACLRYSAAVASCSCSAVGGPLTAGTSEAAIFASTSPRAVRASASVRSARESTSRSRISRCSASCRTVQHGLDLAADVLQGARRTVVARRCPGGRRRAPNCRGAGSQKASGSETTWARSAVSSCGDALQVVAGRVLAGPYADGVRERAGALQLGGEQIYPGGQRRPHRVGGDDHVQRARVQLVHPVDQLARA